MESLIIGFSTPKSFNLFSYLIRLVDGSKFSHAYIRVTDPYTNKEIIYQASGLMVNAISADAFDDKEQVCAEFTMPVASDVKLKTVQFAIDSLGKPYGTKTIIGIGIVKLFGLFRKRIKNPFADGDKSMVCSKLVSFVLDEIIIKTDKIDPQTATPTDVYNFLINLGYTPN